MSSNQIINDIIPSTQFTATPSQVTFNTNWTANATTDVVVFAREAGEDANDILQLVSTSLYTVEFVGDAQTVRVTFLSGRTSGDIITIIRSTPASRLNLYTNTNFTPSMLNEDFAILTLVDQQAQPFNTSNVASKRSPAPRYNLSATFKNDPNIDMILPILGANQVWLMNADETEIQPLTITESTIGGLINPGETGEIAYYSADGSVISGLETLDDAVLTTNGAGFPVMSHTLPGIVIANITQLVGLTGVLQAPTFVNDVSGNHVLGFVAPGLAVNYLSLASSISGSAPQFSASGADTNINTAIAGKGTGYFQTYSTGNIGIQFLTGTGYQHNTTFNFANTLANRTLTYPDATGTVALTSNIPSFPLSPANGGTGVANTGTFTVGGNVAFSGAFTFAGTLTGNTAVTFPLSGTLATTTSNVGTSVTQVFSATGTYTPTAGMVYCKVTVTGAGGGGGSAVGGGAATSAAGAGGGAGESREGIFDAATIGASQAVTIGAGGIAGTGGLAGSAGGNTTFGALVTAIGGGGGSFGNSVSGNGLSSIGGGGGAGGSGGTVVYKGNAGLNGVAAGTSSSSAGGGGAGSIYGGAIQGVTTGNNGNAAISPGGGGSGGAASTVSKNGGIGADGYVTVVEFIVT